MNEDDFIDASELGGIVQPWAVCPECGDVLQIGSWPRCGGGRFDHGQSVQTNVFTPYFDIGLGCEVTSWAQRRRVMKDLHLDFRDKLSRGDLSARLDRVHEQKKEQARC